MCRFSLRRTWCAWPAGSQGEANAALSRIPVINDHRHVQLKEGDRVVLSALRYSRIRISRSAG